MAKNIKKNKKPIGISPDQLADQYWRINNLYWIMDENGRRVLFKLNHAQEELYQHLWYLNLVLKARQRGVTTFVCILMLDDCLFNSNTKAGIIAHNREDAEDFFENKVKYPYDNLPEALRKARPAKSDTLRELTFSNNSTIRVGTSLRSGTFQWLHISEFGKICAKYPDKAREIVTGAMNTVHKGQRIVVESTAEGNSGYFYDYCNAARAKSESGHPLTIMDFKFFFFPWWEDPKYCLPEEQIPYVDIPLHVRNYFKELAELNITLTAGQKAWYVKKLESQQDDMQREFPSTPEEAFAAQIKGCFFAKSLKRHRKTVTSGLVGSLAPSAPGVDKEVLFTSDRDGVLEIWRYPYSQLRNWDEIHWENRYVIGSDIGEGLEQDFSVAHVFDRYRQEFVARMRSNVIDSVRWAKLLMLLSRYYRNMQEVGDDEIRPKNCLIVPERTGAGITVCKQLDDTRGINVYTNMVPAKRGSGMTKQVGWVESKSAKFDLAGDLKEYFQSTTGNIYDAILLNEGAVFIHDQKSKKLGAEEGFHDDSIISAGLALQGHYSMSGPPRAIKIHDTGWRSGRQQVGSSAWVV